ncbi:hypothetical protein JJV70_03495 [Streptomyces sp. JJ66]|uniref:hypothetical protein n=1 Tax=Streptomyces sp. JJ66 TaxID=2803843 RepID=UPI001C56BCA3|nr:hypothetical protein [Streptomyces sp. JJ66]MBW1601181.1 hypothetical protein [Streptomyces sp. JJ66]
MSPQHQITALIQAADQGAESYTLINPWNSRRKFAAFACVAEHYGYRYAGLSPDFNTGRSYPVFAFRRLPDADRRLAHARAQWPQATNGGPLPGMRPDGRALTPLPEHQREVDLLHARIMVDLYGTSRFARLKRLALLVPMGFFAAVALTGALVTAGLALAGGASAIWLAYLFLSSAFMRRRHITYRRRLEAADITWPPR